MAESSACSCFLGFSGTAPLRPIPRCVCPLRAGIKKVLRAGWSVVPPQAAAWSWTDWGWWFQPGSATEPTGARAPCLAFRKASQKLHLYPGKGHTNYPRHQVSLLLLELQEHASAKFWLAVNDIIGISETLDIVTRAGIRHHSPNWTCSIPLEWDWPWIRVPLLSKLSNRLFLLHLAVLIIISPAAMIWFHNIIMNSL